MTRQVILYYAHFCSPAVRREVARLRSELDSRYDIFAIGYCQSAGALGGLDCVPALEYSTDDLIALPYPGKVAKFDPPNFIGNADLVPMKFFLDRPDYDYYWIIEYDVRFSGSWPGLFADLSPSGADLLCTTMQTWAENPNWAHWSTLATGGENVPLERGNGSFTPAERRGRYYQNTPSEWSQFPGTFVYRPCFADRNLFGPQCHFTGTLWHPVKE
jgi:hypothetical protein